MVDHRQLHDLNYARNEPVFTRGWYAATKNRLIGSLVGSFGVYVSGGALVFAMVVAYSDSIYRYLTNDKYQSQLSNPNQLPAEKYLNFANDRTVNTGRWLHNFGCWENEKNCGRDYDWIKK